MQVITLVFVFGPIIILARRNDIFSVYLLKYPLSTYKINLSKSCIDRSSVSIVTE